MEITLKGIKHYKGMSRETESFYADIFINSIKRGYAHNEGSGGPTHISWNKIADKPFMEEAEKYAKTLPSEMFQGIELKSDLEGVVNRLLDDYLFEKDLKKDMNKGILYDATADGYGIIAWKGLTIPKLLASPKGVEAIKEAVAKLKAEGKKIANTNIPAEILA